MNTGTLEDGEKIFNPMIGVNPPFVVLHTEYGKIYENRRMHCADVEPFCI